jgi:hypothetical protein
MHDPAAGLRIRWKCSPRRGDRAIDILGRSETDLSGDLLRSGLGPPRNSVRCGRQTSPRYGYSLPFPASSLTQAISKSAISRLFLSIIITWVLPRRPASGNNKNLAAPPAPRIAPIDAAQPLRRASLFGPEAPNRVVAPDREHWHFRKVLRNIVRVQWTTTSLDVDDGTHFFRSLPHQVEAICA